MNPDHGARCRNLFRSALVLILIFGLFGPAPVFAQETDKQPGQKIVEEAKEALNRIEKGVNDSLEDLPRAPFSREILLGMLLSVLRILLIMLIGWGLYRLLKLGVAKIDERITEKDVIVESDTTLRLKTLTGLAYWAGTLAIASAVIYISLESLGFSMAPLLAGAGIVGLAFGFGGQYLIRDVINGIFILVEGQYHVNDVIKVGDLAGLVEKVNLRVTQLRDLEGRVIFIPNGEIKAVINYTQEWSRALFEIGVAYKENVDQVMEVIREVGKGMREDPHFGRLILEDLEMLGVDSFADSAVTIKFFIKTLPIKQWEVGREFRRRLKNRFDELGIEIPFPHRTVYWGTGDDNAWMRRFFERRTPETGAGQSGKND